MNTNPIQAKYHQYFLRFKRPGGTSRGVLKQKETFILVLNNRQSKGVGECALFRGLSCDDRPDYEEKLQWVCDHINEPMDCLLSELKEFPSIQFGLEQALLSLKSASPFELFPSAFTKGNDSIPINGLIWMGTIDFMKKQIAEKLDQGYATLKLKIGALDFEKECKLLRDLRKSFSVDDLELRVDANGAFTASDALEKLERLSKFQLHSIEQPVKAGQAALMAHLCANSPIDIALDEELIGVVGTHAKTAVLSEINPHYIILKPSLVGGFHGTNEWIDLAQKMKIKWWITSALESNIGLNAIAQYTYLKASTMVQGLGTGGLFTNNFESPLYIEDGSLRVDGDGSWDVQL